MARLLLILSPQINQMFERYQSSADAADSAKDSWVQRAMVTGEVRKLSHSVGSSSQGESGVVAALMDMFKRPDDSLKKTMWRQRQPSNPTLLVTPFLNR